MYSTFEPSPTLAPHVECYWSWRLDQEPGELDVILPDAAPEIIVHFDALPLWRHGADSWRRQPSAFLFCAAHRALHLQTTGPMSLFAVRLRPWGARVFGAGSMAERLDRPVEPEDALGETGTRLVYAIRAADGDRERVRAAETVLSAALRHAEGLDRLEALGNLLEAGVESARQLARSLALSERSMRRLWRHSVGIELRRYSALMRFQRALAMIDDGVDLATVAAACGYSDQSHMARQVKEFSGLTATELRQRLGAEIYRHLYGDRPDAPWRRPRDGEAPPP